MSPVKPKPFQFHANDRALEDLRGRLARTVWPDEVAADAWQFGPPVSYMKNFVDYWLNRYNWREQERWINSFPNYITEIRGNQIHFIHQIGKGPNPVPLVMTHGWPGGFFEMLKIIPMLTDPLAHGGRAEDAFTVVAPSIPGYGFSSRPEKRGMNFFAVADLWAELMEALGYEEFGVQGGDWGSWISASTGLRHPTRVTGIHLNYLSARIRPAIQESDRPLSPSESKYLAEAAKWADAEAAYFAVQATKPLTLAYALSDSPVGLAAWHVEKFRSWTHNLGEPDDALTKDEMITNIMLYWLTGTTHSAMRFYSEAREQPFHFAPEQKVESPTGVVILPAEIPMPPREWVERAFNVVHWTELPKGGHFAAWEVPDLLAEDIRVFFRPLRRPSR